MVSLPDSAEIEISLFGPGYGESIVIHLGQNIWIIIDSCIDESTGDNIPLTYLNDMGVDIETNVKQVICSHWHKDHYKGISEIVKACTSSEFICTSALNSDRFFTLMEIYTGIGKSKSYATKELKKGF